VVARTHPTNQPFEREFLVSMTDLQPPAIEPDAKPQQISPHPPEHAEFGAHTLGREITTYLGQLLHEDITAPVYRCNPFDRRPCAQAQSYEFTAAGHQVLIVCFQDGRGLPAYAVQLGREPVTFELTHYGEYGWQLARGVWMAIRDRPAVTDAPAPSDQAEIAGAA
jgi:hypothetical protein